MKSIAFLFAITLAVLPNQPGDGSPPLEQVLSSGFFYRNLGPFRAGSWISDIAIPEAPMKTHLYTFYVAARNGGIWKTTNNGTTFDQIFERQGIASIGCIAIAPSNSQILWVGTGDASCTRSAYWGNGVYRSLDGGATWETNWTMDFTRLS